MTENELDLQFFKLLVSASVDLRVETLPQMVLDEVGVARARVGGLASFLAGSLSSLLA